MYCFNHINFILVNCPAADLGPIRTLCAFLHHGTGGQMDIIAYCCAVIHDAGAGKDYAFPDVHGGVGNILMIPPSVSNQAADF